MPLLLLVSFVFIIGCGGVVNTETVYPNNQKRWEETYFDNGRREKTTYFNPDGSVMMVIFYDPHHQGEVPKRLRWIIYYPNGALKDDMIYEVKTDVGYVDLSRRWYPSGAQEHEVSQHIDSVSRHGRCTWWDKKGKVIEDCEYRKGKRIRNYLKEGKLRSPLPAPTYRYTKGMKIPAYYKRDDNDWGNTGTDNNGVTLSEDFL